MKAFCVFVSDRICAFAWSSDALSVAFWNLAPFSSGVLRHAAAGEADADEDPDDERDEDGRERRDVVAEVEHAYKSAAVWQSAWSRASAFCGRERLRPISAGPSTVRVASVRSGSGAARRQLDVQPLAGQVEGEALVEVDRDHDERAAHVRLAEERGTVLADDVPARPRREAATVGLEPADAGPPVGQVVRLGQQLPDVRPRREQLARCLHTRHVQSPAGSAGAG